MDAVVQQYTYGQAILAGFEYLLERYPEVFVMGQGLWSPWYVGSSMTALEKRFGVERVIDTPISEAACTAAAIGASLCGYRPIVVHPRMDFMILATDPIVNQAAKWRHMLGGQASPAVTVRGIVNRGGEQGAQHSQMLHAWYAHVPGLRVVLPATVKDARDLLVASVLCDDPVIYIDDRWLYDETDELPPVEEVDLRGEGPRCLVEGSDVTLVGAGYAVSICRQAAKALAAEGVACEVIDLRVINPLDIGQVVDSVRKTRRLCVVDGGWRNCGLAGEVIAAVVERIEPGVLSAAPKRFTLPDAPAPTSAPLERAYYTRVEDVVRDLAELVVA